MIRLLFSLLYLHIFIYKTYLVVWDIAPEQISGSSIELMTYTKENGFFLLEKDRTALMSSDIE